MACHISFDLYARGLPNEQEQALNTTQLYAPRYTVADTFCGCGGLSFGFSWTGRFDTILGLDIKAEALETFAYNHFLKNGYKPVTVLEDIAHVHDAVFTAEINRFGTKELDCLIGGPPCEGFSQNRTAQESGARAHKFIEDPRNYLFRSFIDLAATLKPKVVLIENVPDLVRHRDGETRNEILSALDKAGYMTSVKILNAADYGVPQMRRRAFFLAQRKSDYANCGVKLEFPNPTHQSYPMMHESLIDNHDWLPGDSGYWVNVREAIADLPSAEVGKEILSKHHYPDVPITMFRALMRSAHGLPTNHIARKLGKGGLERLRALRPGQTCEQLPDDLRPKSYFHYSYTRLKWSEPARTVTKFAYHVGSGQFGHPVEDRAITMREAARLQSFPDDFQFVGTHEIRKISALVGSAVPPLLARAIAIKVAQYLDRLYLADMDPNMRKEAKLLRGDAVLRRLESESWGSEGTKSDEHQLALFT